jgi:hypothetical protein
MGGMSPTAAAPAAVSALKAAYDRDGFVVARSLFSPAEVAEIRDHFMRMRAEGPKPGDMGGDRGRGAGDPLNAFARMINMHDWDAATDR